MGVCSLFSWVSSSTPPHPHWARVHCATHHDVEDVEARFALQPDVERGAAVSESDEVSERRLAAHVRHPPDGALLLLLPRRQLTNNNSH